MPRNACVRALCKIIAGIQERVIRKRDTVAVFDDAAIGKNNCFSELILCGLLGIRSTVDKLQVPRTPA
jgi:hypothetical protein